MVYTKDNNEKDGKICNSPVHQEREGSLVEGTVKIKFSRSEVQLLINSLHMSVSTVVPCMENGQWKKPYEKLKGDLEKVSNQIIEKEREININGKQGEKSGANNPAECYSCSD
jgi:hypothetical protein